MNVYIPPLTILGLPVSGIIVLIIERLKRQWPGFFSRAAVAIVTAELLGLVFSALCTVMGSAYDAQTIAVNVIAGLMSGLAAIGVYDAIRSAGYRSVDISGNKQVG